MKLITAALLMTTLSVCIYQNVDSVDIAKATQECSGRGGIEHIRVDAFGGEVVFCMDGTFKDVTKHIVRINEGVN